MNLENQVASLPLSKDLKELGIKQISFLYWNKENKLKIYPEKKYINLLYNISAFTASELIDLLPNRITLKEGEPFNSFKIRIEKSFFVKGERLLEPETIFTIPSYIINYYCDSTECTGENAWLQRQLFPHNIWDENFCNALAKTLIYISTMDIFKK